MLLSALSGGKGVLLSSLAGDSLAGTGSPSSGL